MNRINDLHEVRVELERLGAVVDKALIDGLSAIERDILLDRLRCIYDALRSLEPEAIPDHRTEPAQERPGRADAPIAREIIDSLYGDGELPLHREEEPVEKPAESVKEAAESAVPAPEADPTPAESSGKVLNEAFQGDFSIDLASILASRTNDSLRSMIGLNDRLMLMKDLFDQDADLCERTLDTLDEFDNPEDAYIYLYEHFTLDDSREGGKLLLSLIEKKFA